MQPLAAYHTHAHHTKTQVRFPVAGVINSWACLSLMDESEVSLAPGHAQSLDTFLKEVTRHHTRNCVGIAC